MTAASDIWDTLHDGKVLAAQGDVPGTVHLEIGIAYLCGELQTAGQSLYLELVGCTTIRYEPFEGAPVLEPKLIPDSQLELLSAGMDGSDVVIECAGLHYGGRLRLAYERCVARTAEGTVLSQADLEAAADQYWTAWRKGARPGT